MTNDIKTLLVTGGGRGLARALAERLALDGHRVILTARDEASGDRACTEIRQANPKAEVESIRLDLASFDDIRQFAQALPRELRIDALVHVAGILQQSRKRLVTVNGIEETLAVNALAPFLLTHELLPRLGTGACVPRVVCVSSRLHFPGSRGQAVAFDFDDPNLLHGYHPDRAYKNSKLALLWFTSELARRIERTQLTSHAICPGFVPTTAAASVTGVPRLLLRYILPLMPFATSVDTAVDALRFIAVDRLLDSTSGDFWMDGKPHAASPQAQDEKDAERFWRWAEAITGTGAWSL